MVKFSDDVTQGVEKSAARAMLRAVGLKDEDFQKFQVGIVSAGNDGVNIDEEPLFPASFTLKNIIVVTSSSQTIGRQ